jgi:hypothetical protein
MENISAYTLNEFIALVAAVLIGSGAYIAVIKLQVYFSGIDNKPICHIRSLRAFKGFQMGRISNLNSAVGSLHRTISNGVV